jgi:hypothetical protein
VKAREAPARESARGGHDLLRFVGSVLVSAALCALLLRRISLGELWRWLTQVDRTLFAAYMGLSITGLLARSYRYRLLIGDWVGLGTLTLVTAVRNFLVDLLPARVGSLSYVYLLTRRFGVPLEPVAASFVVTFFYDLFAMTVLIGTAAVLQLGHTGNGLALAGLAAGLGIAVALVFLRLAEALRFAARSLVERAPSVALRLEETAAHVERSGGVGRTAGLMALSVAIRLIKFGAYWALLLAVVRGQDVAAAELPFWTVFLGIAGAELSATLPIHGIAGIGTYETAWAIGFSRLGVSSRVAILSGFATHLLSQVFDYSVGLTALAVALAGSRRRAPR